MRERRTASPKLYEPGSHSTVASVFCGFKVANTVRESDSVTCNRPRRERHAIAIYYNIFYLLSQHQNILL